MTATKFHYAVEGVRLCKLRAMRIRTVTDPNLVTCKACLAAMKKQPAAK